MTAPVTRPNLQDGERACVVALRTAGEDVLPNIDGEHALEIAEMRQQSIEVGDDNDPAPENSEPAMPVSQPVGDWVTPTFCPRRADPSCNNNKGSWKKNSWQKIKEKDKLALFRMCFPKQMPFFHLL